MAEVLQLIAFANPWLLCFLAVLPVIWWLLRLTPPAPKRLPFPALALLRGLNMPEQTPARTPWWLLLLRLLIATVLILAFAQPIIDPAPLAVNHSGILIAVDNDWASARDWPQRQSILNDLIKRAQREHRSVTLLATSPAPDNEPLKTSGLIDAQSAASEAAQIEPQPWPADWPQATALVQNLDAAQYGEAVWLAGGSGNPDAQRFYNALQKIGTMRVIAPDSPLYTLSLSQSDEGARLTVLRADTDPAASLTVDAEAADGNVLVQLPVTFTAGAPQANVPLDIPAALRNQVARFDIAGRRSAATTVLLDSNWQHRPVGLVGDQTELDQHSLLSSLYYIDRALTPGADLHLGRLDQLLQQDMAVIILPDNAMLDDGDAPAVTAWIKRGGVLVRFAGEHFTTADNPHSVSLLPVTLREGDRNLGGSLSWAVPQKLQGFPATSPFHGLQIPDDVTISRQVLAEPSPDLAQNTWAALADGTPLVTGKALGQGYSILFHVPARSGWSNLPLSGLFVEMLKRITDLSQGMIPAKEGAADTVMTFAPLHRLNGFGELTAPNPAAQPLNAQDANHLRASPRQPPGLYGTENFNRAFNLGAALGPIAALNGVPVEHYQTQDQQNDLQPYLLALAFILLLADFLASLHLRGVHAPSFHRHSRASGNPA